MFNVHNILMCGQFLSQITKWKICTFNIKTFKQCKITFKFSKNVSNFVYLI